MTTLGFGMPHGFEWIVLLALGLLLFGRRLPEVGRSLGQSLVEFKRGIKGVTDEVEEASNHPATPALGQPPHSAPALAADRGAAPIQAPPPPPVADVRVSRSDVVE
ncbi:MAG TPA: twin-arginine translocase TatA/TatE family subunit [Phycisphaerales bacterium]|nr:twin-arginine translocase TatA/TatE family subunit [Phycisphaerales bacterium]